MRGAMWVAVAMFWPAQLLAQSASIPREEAFRLSQEFGRCAGLFDAVSEFTRSSDANLEKHYHGLSNGATTAAAMIAGAAIERAKAWDLAMNLRANETLYWRVIVQREGISGEVQDELNRCVALNPLQQRLVEEARRQAHDFN